MGAKNNFKKSLKKVCSIQKALYLCVNKTEKQ